VTYVPDALVRTRRDAGAGRHGAGGALREHAGRIAPHPRHGARLAGADVVLVDDVMTSGATLAAAAEAALAAGAREVCVLVLARVARDP
jgi:predicted amidophosphoribosyltransferase